LAEFGINPSVIDQDVEVAVAIAHGLSRLLDAGFVADIEGHGQSNGGELVPVLTPYASKESTIIAIVYPQKKYRSAKLRVFIEFMTALMADLRREGIVD
jgi:DNA-binding transcriptional LysR family regulator